MEERPVFTQHLRRNAANRPVKHGSYSLVQGDYKLAYYQGWPQQQGLGELVELYNLKDDPQEMEDLSEVEKDRAGYMQELLEAEIKRADDPFR